MQSYYYHENEIVVIFNSFLVFVLGQLQTPMECIYVYPVTIRLQLKWCWRGLSNKTFQIILSGSLSFVRCYLRVYDPKDPARAGSSLREQTPSVSRERRQAKWCDFFQMKYTGQKRLLSKKVMSRYHS